MATQQKRMLTSDKSKLKDVKVSDLSNILATPAAWSTLPLPIRQHLYTLLPPPEPHEPAHDPDINPMQTAYRQYIEEELSQWQADLGNGFETKKWREDAMRASQERLEGKYDAWREAHREEWWGKQGERDGRKEDDGGKEEKEVIGDEKGDGDR
ncbi:hypothetical protein KC343_g1383 [Hortaea werneckii]|uniref:ASX DEUBAD domain-containing protein n=1 Tax=Hortaea werneckii TaxID=91943 RepID=A0A3M7GWK6_HORWE|nr:hypothetical protein KC317_g6519 [Hortaea werneckii]KAI7609577.1 hypothetical protein KC346_g9137 [Hortaea werneckii]KAI7636235.1 hypothetical protein KC343_g1383 [Hortaea werneckii]KAI7721671.1 hypothetical protein KC322_g1563 [Hortaea werneckii]RMZ05358.1 hypothetical protein D0864_02481 [Hortaea werneckii]